MQDSATRSKASLAKQVNTSNEVKATPFNPAKPRLAMTDVRRRQQEEGLEDSCQKVNDGLQPFINDNSLDELRQQPHVSRTRHVSTKLITVSSGSQQQSTFQGKEESPVILTQSLQSEFRIQSPEKYQTKLKQQPSEYVPSRTHTEPSPMPTNYHKATIESKRAETIQGDDDG